MTVEKAIETLNGIKELEELSYTAVEKALDMAIEALEKQIPKLVQIKNWSPAECPSCGHTLSESLGDGYYKHPIFLEVCPNNECCQRLRWE